MESLFLLGELIKSPDLTQLPPVVAPTCVSIIVTVDQTATGEQILKEAFKQTGWNRGDLGAMVTVTNGKDNEGNDTGKAVSVEVAARSGKVNAYYGINSTSLQVEVASKNNRLVTALVPTKNTNLDGSKILPIVVACGYNINLIRNVTLPIPGVRFEEGFLILPEVAGRRKIWVDVATSGK